MPDISGLGPLSHHIREEVQSAAVATRPKLSQMQATKYRRNYRARDFFLKNRNSGNPSSSRSPSGNAVRKTNNNTAIVKK